jgi:transposase
MRWRSAKKLGAWIKAASTSGFHFLAQFANTLRRDLKAVELSITTPWSNGPIEGHINRLKAINARCTGGQDSNFSKRACCHGISNTPLNLCTESTEDPL